MSVSGDVCLMGKGQMCTVKRYLYTSLSSSRISRTGLILMFVKEGISLLMSFMKFSHMFCGLSSTRLSQFNSNTEEYVPDEFQECPQMNTAVMDWLNGPAADFYDEGSVSLVQCLDKCLNRYGGLQRKINILSLVYGTWQPITRVLGPNEWVY
jgi:hypothetical protein